MCEIEPFRRGASLPSLTVRYEPLKPGGVKTCGLLLLPTHRFSGGFRADGVFSRSLKDAALEMATVVRWALYSQVKSRRRQGNALVRFPGTGCVVEKPDPSKWGNWSHIGAYIPVFIMALIVNSVKPVL